MIILEQICNENLSHYHKYEEFFKTDLYKYQSRIYPTDDAQHLCWYHIKNDTNYIGAIWLEKTKSEDFAVLGIFIIDDEFRNKGVGTEAIKQIIENDLKHLYTNRVLLRVREENARAIKCYSKTGFTEHQQYVKNGLNVLEMIYEVQL